MNLLFLWQNLVDTAVSLTPSNELATLPVENIQNPHISRRWGTETTQTLWRVIIDMGTPRTCGVLAVLGTNMTPGSTMALAASNTDPAVLTSLVLQTGSISTGMVFGYSSIYFSFTDTSARYWRVEASDTTLAGIGTRVGRIVIGPKSVLTENMARGGEIGIKDNSRVSKSYGGQAFVNQLPKARTRQIMLRWMSEDVAFNAAFAAFRDNGQGTDMLILQEDAGAFIHHKSIWGLATVDGFRDDSPTLYSASISIEERL